MVDAMTALRGGSRSRWHASALAALGSFLLLGLPTELVPNPVFGRQIPAPSWTLPVLVLTAILSGLLLATYVRHDGPMGATDDPDGSGAMDGDQRRATLGGALSFLAIGCPTCNKLVLLALGSSGAITWFEPVQPVLAGSGVALLMWALWRRLAGEVSCRITVG
jgi:hypothetical protein